MAKIRHNDIIDTINDIVKQAKDREIIHLGFDAERWDGRKMPIGERELLNFGTCGYLGLETHPSVVERSMEFTKNYGTQFSISRAYVTSKINKILEEQMSSIFDGCKTITFSSTTLAHVAVLPIIVSPSDAIILDQQAHVSMQNAAQLMAPKGVPIEMIRHSNLDMLERKIQGLRDKCDRIWYVIDGVYSMYGDIAPLEELNQLAEKYSQLHFYVDDAHGMSWTGTNGSGRVFDQFRQNEKTLLVTTMAKGFGSVGGLVVFPNTTWYDRVYIHGGPLAYSHPIPPSVIGASSASAEIHLTEELTILQGQLGEKIQYCNELLAGAGFPVMSNPTTPIYFVGTGQPNVGYNLNKRMLNDGFYVNIGMFPAVSVKNTGLRFTITNHIEIEDIKHFVNALSYHYPKALEEEGKTIGEVRKAFKLKELVRSKEVEKGISLRLERYHSIRGIRKSLWDKLFFGKGNFDWEAMLMIESSFSENKKEEENWQFYYVLIFDERDELILATFLSSGLFKDDLVSPIHVSKVIEDKREQGDPYYLCSKTLTMGSLFSEGEHLQINRTGKQWKKAVKVFLTEVQKISHEIKANSIVFRDFYEEDGELFELFYSSGLFRIELPSSNILCDLKKVDTGGFIASLSTRSRRHFRNDILKFMDRFDVSVSSKLKRSDLKVVYELYRNVGSNNLGLNIFPYPFKLIENINNHSDWEFIKIELSEKLVAVGCCFISGKDYFPILVGLDYEVNRSHRVYKQMLFQVVQRAMDLSCETVHFGFSADMEKKKLGSKQFRNIGFMEIKDNFNFEVISNISV